MKVWDSIKNYLASFRTANGMDLPDTGRSSDESLKGLVNTSLARFSTVSPIVNFEMLALLKNLSIYNPDMSQFCTNIVNLANTGHTIQIDARNSAGAEGALIRLNETSQRIYRNGAGVDGLMNAYLYQIGWSGALSSEDVVNFAGRRVEQTVLVPVEQIRFRYEDGQYLPYQRPANFFGSNISRDAYGLIKLNSETYRYYALQTIENSPYAKPPGSAAIEMICESQKPIFENIRYIAQKFGLLGLVTASVVPPPKRPSETDQEHQARSTSYLSLVAKRLEGMFRNGLLVTFRDQKIEHTKVNENASGVYEINRMSEEQVMSGFGMQPAFFGRTDSTTETFADVVYSLLMAQVHNIQRLVKRRQEQTYRLDLRLGGLEVDGVSIRFNRTFSRNIVEENNAEKTKWDTVLAKVKEGLLDPTEGAQELGQESWFDEDLIGGAPSVSSLLAKMQNRQTESFSFKFAKDAQRYEFVRPQLSLASDNSEEEASRGNVIPIKKKAPLALTN